MTDYLGAAEKGAESPTFQLSFSRTGSDWARLLTDVVKAWGAEHENGASITLGVGIWEGEEELLAMVRVQAEPDLVNDLLGLVAYRVGGLRFVHVEELAVNRVLYVDLHPERPRL